MATKIRTKPFKDTEEGKEWKPIEIDGIPALAKRDKDAPSFAKWEIIEADTGLSLLPPSWRGGLSAGTLDGAKGIVQIEVIDKKGKDRVLKSIQDAREEMGIVPSPSGFQTERGMAQDKARTNKITLSKSDKRFKAWQKNPGSMDVEGIDTPRKSISKRSARITPKTPRLKR